METIHDYVKEPTNWDIAIFPFTEMDEFIKEAATILEMADIARYESVKADLTSELATGIVVYDSDSGEAVAANAMLTADFGTSFFSVMFGMPNFAEHLNSRQIKSIIQEVGLPIDWCVPSVIPKSFPSYNSKLNIIDLPKTFDAYLASLSKNNRRNAKKAMQHPVSFREISVKVLLAKYSVTHLAKLQAIHLGGSYHMILARLPYYLNSRYIQVLEVLKDGRLIGYDLGFLKGGIYYALSYIHLDPLYRESGLYFTEIFCLIKYLIENNVADTLDLMCGAMEYKQKFLPVDNNGYGDISSLAICNYTRVGNPSVYEDEEFMPRTYVRDRVKYLHDLREG